MKKAVIGLFDEVVEVRRALLQLHDMGFDIGQLSVLAKEDRLEDLEVDEDLDDLLEAPAFTVEGTAFVNKAGIQPGSGGPVTVPGVGPVMAYGSAMMRLGEYVEETEEEEAELSMPELLMRMGVPESDADVYAEGIKRGGLLVVVPAEARRAPMVNSVLEQTNAVDVGARRKELEEEGWEAFRAAAT